MDELGHAQIASRRKSFFWWASGYAVSAARDANGLDAGVAAAESRRLKDEVEEIASTNLYKILQRMIVFADGELDLLMLLVVVVVVEMNNKRKAKEHGLLDLD
jgi:hypothetical protein